METIDQVIERYAEMLQQIYDKQTAGDYTFHGVLAEFYKAARNAA